MNKFIILLAIVTTAIFTACNSKDAVKNFKSEKENLSVAEASALLNDSALLIDVRQPDEVAEQSYDVKNSVNIPLDSLESKINSLPKNKLVILACQRGGRSQKAFDLLKSKGFTNIANLEGGMYAWNEAGLPTKTSNAPVKACCANPNSKDCNPDGTCKTPTGEKSGSSKSCCDKPETKSTSSNTPTKNHLEVYAFHGTRQCETCINMKTNTKATLEKYFSEQLKNGSIVFSIVDVDDEKNEKLAEKFQATGTALMVDNVVNGKDNIFDWSDFAFDKANDAEFFIPELKTKIEALLK